MEGIYLIGEGCLGFMLDRRVVEGSSRTLRNLSNSRTMFEQAYELTFSVYPYGKVGCIADDTDGPDP